MPADDLMKGVEMDVDVDTSYEGIAKRPVIGRSRNETQVRDAS